MLCLSIVELGYRVLDPFPYISQNDVNHTEYGNLSEYDPLLGWRGTPSAQSGFITVNSRTLLKNNRLGFRDIEHKIQQPEKPAIVFLGDSFTWGYEVNFDEMFVNLLRNKFGSYSIYNLSHRGYGTDQELLTFRNWSCPEPIKRVILMFSENDVDDNNSDISSGKPKPMFRLINNKLVLTGTPIPKLLDWQVRQQSEVFAETWKTRCIELLLRSHLLHDIAYRILLRVQHIEPETAGVINPTNGNLLVTGRILDELKHEVSARKAELIIFFIPSKREIERLDSNPPYQRAIAEICDKLGIVHYDMAPDFKKTWLRSYYRQGMHWNSYGNKIAAQVIARHLHK